MKNQAAQQITVLGVGNILFSDEGLGVRVVEKLLTEYEFPENVSIEDGGVLGLGLLGIMSETDHLIVVDAVRNGAAPGTFCRLEGDQIPRRVLAKNSLHQVDFLEAFTCCNVLGHVPETVILGVEPQDIDTLSIQLTPAIQDKVDFLANKVLSELDRLGAKYRYKGERQNVSGHSFKNH